MFSTASLLFLLSLQYIGALGEIYVVIGMEQILPSDLVATIGDYLVYIHVGLGAAAGLPDR